MRNSNPNIFVPLFTECGSLILVMQSLAVSQTISSNPSTDRSGGSCVERRGWGLGAWSTGAGEGITTVVASDIPISE